MRFAGDQKNLHNGSPPCITARAVLLNEQLSFSGMRSGTYFEIQIEAEDGLSKVHVNSEAEVRAFAHENLRPKVELLVACLGGGVDYGNLIIEVDAHGSCDVRALEHRGFFVNGISMQQANEALEYWLPSQERTPNLRWQDE